MNNLRLISVTVALFTASIQAETVSKNMSIDTLVMSEQELASSAIDYRAKYKALIDSFLTKMDIEDREFKIVSADTTSPTDGTITIDRLKALGVEWTTPQATFGKDPKQSDQQKVLSMFFVKTIDGDENMTKFNYEGISNSVYKKYNITPIKGQDGCGNNEGIPSCYRSFRHDDMLIEVSFTGDFLFLNMTTKF